MKPILFFLSMIILASCSTIKPTSNTSATYWPGKDGTLTIVDVSGKETYEPVQMKYASRLKFWLMDRGMMAKK